MAMPIKFVPILTGQTAANFVAEANSNKNQATPTLSGKAAERLKKVLEKSKAFFFSLFIHNIGRMELVYKHLYF